MKTKKFITNSDFARIFKQPMSKVRRNTKEFLPPDPQASRQSGYSRKFDTEDAFRVFIGTLLVSDLGYSFKDARTIISDLWLWAESVNLVPGRLKPLKGIDSRLTNYQMKIYKGGLDFNYIIYGEVKNASTHKNIIDPVRGEAVLYSTEKCRYEFNTQSRTAKNKQVLEKNRRQQGSFYIPDNPEYSSRVNAFEERTYVPYKTLNFSLLYEEFMEAIKKL